MNESQVVKAAFIFTVFMFVVHLTVYMLVAVYTLKYLMPDAAVYYQVAVSYALAQLILNKR